MRAEEKGQSMRSLNHDLLYSTGPLESNRLCYTVERLRVGVFPTGFGLSTNVNWLEALSDMRWKHGVLGLLWDDDQMKGWLA